MPLPDHYATLGVLPQASQDEIKRHYRGLARQYHPDVNPSPDAAQRIKVINEAYHVVGDVDRRATYDAERMLAEKAASAPRPAPAASGNAPKTARSQTASSSGGARTQFEFNGFGRVTTGQAPPTRATATRVNRTAPSQEETRRKAERLIAEAQLAYVNRRYREAEEMCQEILTVDRRNAVAHEIIGDILMKRGQKAAAELHYSYAVQFNPQNRSVQAKLERLMGNRPAPPSPGPTMARSEPVTPREALANFPHTEALITTVSILLTAGFAGILMLLWSHPGEMIFSGFLSAFSVNLFGALAVNGVIGGILLAFFGGMRPASEELFSHQNLRGDQQTTVSLGAILVGFAFIWFYASILIYIGISFARNRLSPSILRLYGAGAVLTGLFAFLTQSPQRPDAWLQVAALGGNLLFPALVLGWVIGDVVRLRDRTL